MKSIQLQMNYNCIIHLLKMKKENSLREYYKILHPDEDCNAVSFDELFLKVYGKTLKRKRRF